MPKSSKLRVLFLFPYPSDTAGSQRFRFEQYWEALDKAGIRYDKQSFLDEKTWAVLYQPGHLLAKIGGILRGFLRRWALIFRLPRYDRVFIHRELSPIGPPLLEWMIARIFQKKIIFDFDDAIWLPNTSAQNSLASRIKFHQKTQSICRWAYRVSAGNAYLAAFAREFNPRVRINPTTLDTERRHNTLRIHQAQDKPVIGWTGTHSTLPYLTPLIPLLQALEKEISFTFLVIANQAPDFAWEGLSYRPWKAETEIEDLLTMHIGLMPLKDDIWAQGKCGFKALQYMSLGIPALLSPVGVNQDIVEHGEEGFHCRNDEDWLQYMKVLLQDPVLRTQMGKKGRDKVIAQYSVGSNRENYLRLFD